MEEKNEKIDGPNDGDKASAKEMSRAKTASSSKPGVRFPWKLHQLLSTGDEKGTESIISWLPSGKSFKVHNKLKFAQEVMPKYFNSNKYKSFQRSLNVWGFECVSQGQDKGAVYSKWFERDQPDLIQFMTRQSIKDPASSSKNSATAASAAVANRRSSLSDLTAASAAASGFESSAEQGGQQGQPRRGSLPPPRRQSSSSAAAQQQNSMLSNGILPNGIATATGMMQSSLSPMVPPSNNGNTGNMSFPRRLYNVLMEDSNKESIAWMPHGRSFRVVNPQRFEKDTLPKFNLGTYFEFVAQLNAHGFISIPKGRDMYCFYHELMIRGFPHLCKYLSTPEDARRFQPGPEEGFDFYPTTSVSSSSPIPQQGVDLYNLISQGGNNTNAVGLGALQSLLSGMPTGPAPGTGVAPGSRRASAAVSATSSQQESMGSISSGSDMPPKPAQQQQQQQQQNVANQARQQQQQQQPGLQQQQQLNSLLLALGMAVKPPAPAPVAQAPSPQAAALLSQLALLQQLQHPALGGGAFPLGSAPGSTSTPASAPAPTPTPNATPSYGTANNGPAPPAPASAPSAANLFRSAAAPPPGTNNSNEGALLAAAAAMFGGVGGMAQADASRDNNSRLSLEAMVASLLNR